MAVIGELATLITARTQPFQRGIANARKSAGMFRSRISELKSSVGGLALQFAGAATAAKILSDSLRLAAAAEQAQVSFEVLLGSAKEAKQLMEDLEGFAATTPFQLEDLTTASKNLAAFGTEGAEIIPTLRVLGDLASAMGIRMSELAEIYGKAQVQGRLFMEDINQIQGRGIPIMDAMAEALGKSVPEIRTMVSEGQIGFEQLRNAMIDLTGEGSQFGGMMERQSKTSAGSLSTLKDAFAAVQREVGETVIEMTGLTENMQAFTGFISGIGDHAQAGFFSLRSAFLDLVAFLSDKLFLFIDAVAKGIETFTGGVVRVSGQEFLTVFAEELRRRADEDSKRAASAILRIENAARNVQDSADDLAKVEPTTQLIADAEDPFQDMFEDIRGSIADIKPFDFADDILRTPDTQRREAGVAQRDSVQAAKILSQVRGASQEQKQAKRDEERNSLLAAINERVSAGLPIVPLNTLL